MNFFRKSHNEEPVKESQGENAAPIDASTPTMDADRTSSDIEPDININTPAIQKIIRKEARQLRMNELIMSEPHLARTQDALHLNETKMENIEDNLSRTRKQQERVRRYHELTMELEEQKKHLYDINKQMASCVEERDDLHRFEEFENVQGKFQRLTTLEGLRHVQKQRMSQLAHEHEPSIEDFGNEQKQLKQLQDENRETILRFEASLEAVGEAQCIESRNNYLSIVRQRIEERATEKSNARKAIEKEIAEHKSHLDEHNKQTEALRTRRQTIQPHQRMAIHAELILERLAQFNHSEEEVQRLEHQQAECQRKQTQENDMLGRVYASYQQVEQKIQALTDELHVHREHNLGLESYRLEERAMKHKLRREMLLSAQSLWQRIASGYAMIEERMQAINAMRLKQENLSTKVEALDKELAVLRRNCHEKEYTFTLSKSQNVIQLRGDLKEGTSCTVCGATHHPYHSDTILDQNKLISEIKMEYESMAAELHSKEQQLLEMQLDVATVTAQKEEAENTLITLRQLQNGFVRDWQMYSNLDRSFAQCDSSTNADARTAMLRQLIENITSEVDKAQKELDTFNFHQSRINELTEQIATEEQNKNDIITRLNEVNTSCQVIANQLESVFTQRQKANDDHSRLYEVLDKMITLQDWYDTWQRSHETLIMHIQELAQQWNKLNEQIEKAEYEQKLKEQKLQYLIQINNELTAETNALEQEHRENLDLYEEGQKKHKQLMGDDSSKQRLRTCLDELQAAKQLLEKQQEKLLHTAIKERELAGRQSENIEQGNILDEKAAAERQAVDVWMRQYNANHSPVQYSELEEVFGTDHNWNDMRVQIRKLEMESILTQSRVDKLNSLLIALQAEGSLNNSADTDTIQHQLSAQIETLEGRRREVMMAIATLTLQIEQHNKAKVQMKEEKMKE